MTPPDQRLRALPSVERLAQTLSGLPQAVAVQAARSVIVHRRASLAADLSLDPDPDSLSAEAAAEGRRLLATSPRPVINATGVIIHTNLGRAPLAGSAREAAAAVGEGYSNLELELSSGRRGSRHDHLASLLSHLTGAEDALVVNNGAAAALLACAALGGDGEVVVSRGQLVEIGGSFRVPEIVAQAGARLVEVGTTNRTRLEDYRSAVGDRTAAFLRVHPSNFRTVGFVEEVEIEELCSLGSERGVPVIDDVGSGALAEAMPELADEPPVRRSVSAGAAITCFSGDKLLGGPQAGIMVGTAEAVERCRRHPLARALRIDKLSLAALGATLRLYLDPDAARREVPVLAMLAAGEDDLAARARRIAAAVGDRARVVTGAARVGGGALPLLELEGPVCAVDPAPLGAAELAARLRGRELPVVTRVSEGRVVLDPRTMSDADAVEAASAVADALD